MSTQPSFDKTQNVSRRQDTHSGTSRTRFLQLTEKMQARRNTFATSLCPGLNSRRCNGAGASCKAVATGKRIAATLPAFFNRITTRL